MNGFIFVALGGAIGASLRYGTGLAVGNGAVATLFVNVVGSFLLGLLTAWGVEKNWPGEEALWLLVGVGALGAFTTFSAFSRETIHLLMSDEGWKGFVYIGLNLVGSVGAFAIALYGLRKVIS